MRKIESHLGAGHASNVIHALRFHHGTGASPSLLPPGSRWPHYWYWALIFVLTLTVGFGPLFVFIGEVQGRHGQLPSIVAFFVLPVWLASFVGSRLPGGYYRCHPFERQGRVYEMLGVRYFRMLVPHGDAINWLVRRSQPGYRVVRNRQTLADYEARTRQAEAFHLGCLFVMAPAAVYATFAGWSRMALWLTLPSIPLHVYPLLLQRYTRARMKPWSEAQIVASSHLRSTDRDRPR